MLSKNFPGAKARIGKQLIALLLLTCAPLISRAVDDVRITIEALSAEDLTEQENARKSLAEIVNLTLAHPSPEERQKLENQLLSFLDKEISEAAKLYVLRQLEFIGTEHSAGPVGELLDTSASMHIHHAALMTLSSLNCDRSIERLQSILNTSTSPEETTSVINALSYHPSKGSIEVLLAQLKRKRPEIQVAAIEALAKIGDPEATKPVFEIYLDPASSPEVSRAAASALLAINCSLQTKQAVFDRDPSPGIRSAIFLESTSPPSRHALSNLGLALADSNFPGRAQIIRWAMQSEDRDLKIMIVAQIMTLPHSDQLTFVGAVKDFRMTEYQSEIIQLAKSNPAGLEQAVIEALGFVGNHDCLPYLQQIYGNAERELKELIEATLNRIADPEIDVELLNQLTNKYANDLKTVIGMIAARNTGDTTNILVKALEESNRPENSIIIIKALEASGSIDAVGPLLKVAIESNQSGLARQALSAAKRVATNHANGEDIWPIFDEMLRVNSNTESISKMIRILDAADCKNALQYLLRIYHESDSGLHSAALSTLCRWPSLGGAEALIQILQTENPSRDEVDQIYDALTRMIESNQTVGEGWLRLKIASQATSLAPTISEEKKIFEAVQKVSLLHARDKGL